MKRFFVAFAALLAVSPRVEAATYSFVYEWDGTTLIEMSAPPLAGTILTAGDDFDLTIRAAGHGFWSVGADEAYRHPLNPRYVNGSNVGTTADAVTSFFLDGALVDQDTELGRNRCCAELGVNDWRFLSAISFDEIVLDYTLTAIWEGTPAALSGAFWNDTHALMDFTYVSAVPLPASAALYCGVVLAGGALSLRRRRRRAGQGCATG